MNKYSNKHNIADCFFIALKNILLITSLFVFFTGCKKDGGSPECGYVNYSIYTSEPQFLALNAISGFIYIGGGCKGIIVYRRNQDEFLAYERACTFDADNSCPGVTVEGNNINAVDTCCGSKFQLFDGNVTNGPASRPLQQYRTSFDGSVLQISN